MVVVASTGSAVLDAMRLRIRQQTAEYASYRPEGSHEWAPVVEVKETVAA